MHCGPVCPYSSYMKTYFTKAQIINPVRRPSCFTKEDSLSLDPFLTLRLCGAVVLQAASVLNELIAKQ